MNKQFLLFITALYTSLQLHSQTANKTLRFDGANDYVTIDALAGPLSNAANFTIEFQMKADFNNNTSSPRVNLFAVNPAAPNDNKFSIIMGNSGSSQTGQLSVYEAGGSTNYLTSTNVIGDNNCHHIAYVRKGSIGEAFIDGVSIGTLAAGTAFSSSDRISLGQEWDNLSASDFYNGNIDELRVWNAARTPLEIQSNMNSKLTGNEPGLIAYYNFDQGIAAGNNTGITTLNDLTTANYDGALVNFGLNGNTSNWITGNCLPSENALQFDGSNDYLTIDALAGPLSAAVNFTIEFWMKADFNNNTSSPRVNFFAINPAAPNDNKFSIIMGNSGSSQTGQLSIYEAGGSNNYLTSTAVIGDNKCHHVAYVRTGNTGEAFMDGVSIGTLAVGTALSSNYRISLGQEWDNLSPSDFYTGELDELRVWDVARTQSQIKANMHSKLTGSETGLIGYYNFNQGTDGGNNAGITTLNDLTSSNIDGTLINFGLTGSTSNWVSEKCSHETGIEDHAFLQDILIYPNPTDGWVTIGKHDGLLTITDILGRIVYTSQANETNKVDLSNCASGIYIVILTDRIRTSAKKLVKK